MEHKTEFRCPFQIKGEKEGTIVEIALNEDKNTRLSLLAAAFQYFYSNPKTALAIRMKIPEIVLETCKTFEELKHAMFTYQAEMLATELDYRLSPLLPYQITKETSPEVALMFEKEPHRSGLALPLVLAMDESGFDMPKHVADLSLWIETIMKTLYTQGVKNPQLVISDKGFMLMNISAGGVTFYVDQYLSGTDPSINRNCFAIVLCPLYPPSFGRYSKDVEIVVSREVDFNSLPKKTRQKIRKESNQILRSHGIVITDLLNDKQPDGLWIPEYVKV